MHLFCNVLSTLRLFGYFHLPFSLTAVASEPLG